MEILAYSGLTGKSVQLPCKYESQMGLLLPTEWKVIKFHGSKPPTSFSWLLIIRLGLRVAFLHNWNHWNPEMFRAASHVLVADMAKSR